MELFRRHYVKDKKQRKHFSALPISSAKTQSCYVNGLLRLGGRLNRASVSFYHKHLFILPNTLHLTNLFVLCCHSVIGHDGANMMLNQLPQRYWILQSTAVVRRVLKSCMHCRQRYEQPAAQMMTDISPLRRYSSLCIPWP